MWKIKIIFDFSILLFVLINSTRAQKRSFYVVAYGSSSVRNGETRVLAKATISLYIFELIKKFLIKLKSQGKVKTCGDLSSLFNVDSDWIYPDNSAPVYCCPPGKLKASKQYFLFQQLIHLLLEFGQAVARIVHCKNKLFYE